MTTVLPKPNTKLEQSDLARAVIAQQFDGEKEHVVLYNEDGHIILEEVESMAGSLLKGGELNQFCWIRSDIENDKGRYYETVLLERSPDDDENGIGAIAVGLYGRNTDIEDQFSEMSATFDGHIFLTNAKDHEERLKAATVRYNEITVAELMSQAGEILDTLARQISILEPVSFDAECIKKREAIFMERFKNMNRSIALAHVKRTTGD